MASVVTYSVLTALLTTTLTWGCGFYLEVAAFDVISHPLTALWKTMSVLTLWNLVALTFVLTRAREMSRIHARSVLVGILLNSIVVLLYHVLLVAFGASLTENIAETFHLGEYITHQITSLVFTD